MRTAYSCETKDEMACDREEKFLETQDDRSDIVGVTANEKAMTRRILLNLDFRYGKRIVYMLFLDRGRHEI